MHGTIFVHTCINFQLQNPTRPMHTIYQYMATVKKITRTVNYLPPMKSLHDWFNYAFKSSELDEVNRFPRCDH